MGLEKAILSQKEYRRPYRGSKAFDSSCRNHGGCSWCLGNRIHKYKIKEESADFRLKEFLKESEETCCE